MLDPLFAVVIATICLVFFLLISGQKKKKNGFDEIWNEETKKLLSDQKEKKDKLAAANHKKKDVKSKTEPKAAKQKAKEINLGMVQARLSALPDLEPEYVAFIQGHVQKLDQQVKELTDTVAQLTSEKTAAEKLADSLKGGRSSSESKIAELKNANTELNGKINKLYSVQNDLATKLKKAETDKQSAHDSAKHVKEESREFVRQIAAVNKQMADVRERSEVEKKELVEKMRKLEDNAHLHHVDITALKEKNDELNKQVLRMEKKALEKEQLLKSQQGAGDKEKETIRLQYENEKKLSKEDEVKMIVEVNEVRELLAKITDELAVFETNNRRLTEHNEKALVENGKLFGQNEQLVAANSELSVRCDALERELSEKTARLASQLEKEREKERELAEHNANQEKLIKQLQANPSREELEYLQQENMRLTEMLADVDPLLTTPKATRAPPPTPESSSCRYQRPMSGDSQEAALLKLQEQLEDLEKKDRQQQRDRIAGMLKSLEESQNRRMESSLSRQRAELNAIDQVKATVEQTMETLLFSERPI